MLHLTTYFLSFSHSEQLPTAVVWNQSLTVRKLVEGSSPWNQMKAYGLIPWSVYGINSWEGDQSNLGGAELTALMKLYYEDQKKSRSANQTRL